MKMQSQFHEQTCTRIPDEYGISVQIMLLSLKAMIYSQKMIPNEVVIDDYC